MARRTVVILGGTGGIGIATVRKFFKEEECDIITVSYNKDEIAAAEKEFVNPNGSFTAYFASVSDVDAMTKIYEEIDAKYGKIDCFVNAVGTIKAGNIEVHTIENFKAMLDINLTGVFIALKLAIPYLKKAGHSAVVNIASISSKIGGSSIGYSVAKAGVDMLSRDAARDLAKYGIRVNTVNPGMTVTNLHVKNGVMDQEAYDKMVHSVEAGYPLGLGKPDEIADPIYFLCSDDARWVTGINMFVDGGKIANFK